MLVFTSVSRSGLNCYIPRSRGLSTRLAASATTNDQQSSEAVKEDTARTGCTVFDSHSDLYMSKLKQAVNVIFSCHSASRLTLHPVAKCYFLSIMRNSFIRSSGFLPVTMHRAASGSVGRTISSTLSWSEAGMQNSVSVPLACSAWPARFR